VGSSIHNDPAQKVNQYISQARESAGQGDEPKARGLLAVIKNIPYAENFSLSAEVKAEMEEIRKLASLNAFEVDLTQAQAFAAKGEVGMMEGRLAEARENARRAGITLSEEDEDRFSRITKAGHMVGMRVRFEDAVQNAKEGHIAGAEGCFRSVRMYAQKADVVLTAEVEKEMDSTMKLARRIAISNVLTEAQQLVSRGDYSKGGQYLSLAGWHAQQGGIVLDEQQEAKHQAILIELIRVGLRRS
jgi:hypothetical protein